MFCTLLLSLTLSLTRILSLSLSLSLSHSLFAPPCFDKCAHVQKFFERERGAKEIIIQVPLSLTPITRLYLSLSLSLSKFGRSCVFVFPSVSHGGISAGLSASVGPFEACPGRARGSIKDDQTGFSPTGGRQKRAR